MTNYMVTREEVQHYSDEYFKYIKNGILKIKFYKTYALEDVKSAHEVCVFVLLTALCSFGLTIVQDLQSRKTSGKLLVKI